MTSTLPSVSTASSSVHILVDRPIVETDAGVCPTVTFRDLPSDQLGASAIVSIFGDEAERRAFAADLRTAADFVEAWVRPDPEPVGEAVPA